jgi:hypothetical protein
MVVVAHLDEVETGPLSQNSRPDELALTYASAPSL